MDEHLTMRNHKKDNLSREPFHTARDCEEDRLRGRVYALLANLLTDAPDEMLLEGLCNLPLEPGDDAPLSPVWRDLKQAALIIEPYQINDEYHALFIGTARGEVLPYASWYLKGSLIEQPVSAIRADLRTLAIQRRDDRKEPEDHLGSLCEVMALLCENPDRYSRDQQAQFFHRHLWSWAKHCFESIAGADAAKFYRPVGKLGVYFMEFEHRYLDSLRETDTGVPQ